MPSSEDIAFAPLTGVRSRHPFRPFGAPLVADVPSEPSDPRALAFEAGRAQGRAEAAAEQALLACEVGAALAAIGAWRVELRTRYTQDLVSLAIRVAETIVGEALAADPARWVPIVGGAIRRLVDAEAVTVRVAPRLAALLRAHLPALAGGTAEVRLVEDPALASDACRVESRAGDVDCALATQLTAVADALGTSEP